MNDSKKQPKNKSIAAAIEQIAQLLRSQVKAVERIDSRRQIQFLSEDTRSSMSNEIAQIAKLLRTQIHKSKRSSRKTALKAKASPKVCKRIVKKKKIKN